MPLPEFPEKISSLSSEELEGMDEVIYIRPDDGASFSLNLTAAAVLDLCDGTRSRDDIARQLAECLPAGSTPDAATIRSDVDDILHNFVDLGLIYADNAASD